MREIYLNKPDLEGELDLSDFTQSLLRIYISLDVNKAKITFKNLPKKAEIVDYVEAQK